MVTCDILRGTNVSIWGSFEGAGKATKIIKTGVSDIDIVIGRKSCT